jgi:disulfide bond formation protein DsbB
MTGHIRVKGVKDTALIRIGLIFAVIGGIAEFAGVATLIDLIKGNQANGILWIIAGLLGLSIAGYMFWGYRWVKTHPSEVKERAEAAYGQDSWQKGGDDKRT